MPSTTPITQNSFFDLIQASGPVAKMVLLVLLIASFFCWAIIFTKSRSLRLAMKENALFLNTFWNGKDIEEIFSKSDRFPRSPVCSVFKSGVKELRKLSAGGETGSMESHGVDNINRALNRASNAEIANLEKHVSWLATTASAAPFVGLFGTVWGIMNSFQSIGATGAASLAVVAPGISEALITTATGIAAAIPAVIAYNHFNGTIRRLAVDIDNFSQDFTNIVSRSVMAGRKGTP